tara:strand:+ start:2558 stop:2797 length:240 start_codon:yes stop_codon:yes gene_type:complete
MTVRQDKKSNKVNSKQGQKGMVLFHLEERGSITALEALSLYRIFRLSARIYDLRAGGHRIHTQWKKDLTGKKYAQYWLR